MVSRACVVGIKSAGIRGESIVRTSQGGIPPVRRAKAVAGDGNHGLEHCMFEINQAQLDGLRVLLHVPSSISIRALARSELFHDAIEADNEVPFPVAALECEVRLPLPPLLRQLLSKIPLHLLQASLALWENLLALIIMWHKAHA